MARTATVHAQAKINLRLAILARDTSGYHAIETIFHRLALADTIRVTPIPSREITVTCTVDVGPAEENLAYRAARAYIGATEWATGVAIEIDKVIPTRGGLGGGSADAAATLRALDALNPAPIGTRALLTIAASLGADIPFLVSDAVMALAWGRGDRLLTLDPLPERHVVLVTPNDGVNTGEAYGWVAESRAENRGSHPIALRPWQLANWSELRPIAMNDFTPVVAPRYPAIGAAIDALRALGASIAEMSGSGSTVFGIFDSPPALAILEQSIKLPFLLTKTASSVEAVELTV